VQTRERDTRRRGYTWGVNAQIKSIIDELRTDAKLYGYVDPNHGITAYRYDEMNSLVSAETRRRHFTYRSADEVGNIYETEDNSDRIYKAGSRLEQAGVNTNELKNIYQGGKGKLVTKGTEFAYDVEGNLSQKTEKNGDVWRYEYFGNGMLSKVVRPDGEEVTFRYDALGRRVEKKTSETTKRFLWDGNRPLHEWKEDKDKDITTWVFDGDGFVPAAKLTNAGNYGIISDHIGTPVEAFDAKGERVWSAELDIYGRVKEFTGEENFIPFRYQGQYADPETGLYYNRFRYYDPVMGQYTQQDPIGLAGGNPTLYGYVGNILCMVDVFGLYNPWDFQFTQESISSVFQHGPFAGQSLDDVISLTAEHGSLPKGLNLTFERMQTGQGEVLATLNNRTLYVAQEAGLTNVNATDLEGRGLNQFNKIVNQPGGGIQEKSKQPNVRREC
jgi:RHS repeat-associated protein